MKADDRRIVQELASHYGLSANVQSGYMFYVCHTLFTSLIIMEKSRTSPPSYCVLLIVNPEQYLLFSLQAYLLLAMTPSLIATSW